MSYLLGIMITSALLPNGNLSLKAAHQAPPHQPAVVRAVAPIYPAMAATLGISGRINLEATIDAHGRVTSLHIVDGPELLRKSAGDTAQRWLFDVADNDRSAREAQLFFTFTLLPRESSANELQPIFLPPYSVEVRGRVPELKTLLISDPPASKRHARTRKKKL